MFGTKELLYRDPGISCFMPIPLRPRPRPPVLADTTDPTKSFAVCSLSAAAFGCPGIEPGRAQYVRILQGIQWPYDEKYGGQRYEPDAKGAENWNPARVIGTVPLEADGSAHFKVPVDEAVYFQLLDENHMELRRMRSFISFQPGEQRACVGCHETQGRGPARTAGSRGHAPRPGRSGAAALGHRRHELPPRRATDLRPALHELPQRPEAGRGSRLLRRPDQRSARPHPQCGLRHDLQPQAHRPLERQRGCPDHDAAGLRLAPQQAGRGAPKRACSKRAKLSEAEWLRLVTWIDLNGPYHDRFINKRTERPAYDLAADVQLASAIPAVHAKRCATCHKRGDVSRLSLIDLRQPDR